MKRSAIISICISMLLSVNALAATRKSIHSLGVGQIYVGGKIGVAAPLALGRTSDQVSFKDVASAGFVGLVDGMWIQSQNIGLGAELGFWNFPFKEQYWSGLNQRGNFDAKYRDYSASLTGRIFFAPNDLKGFVGANFGMHVTDNSLSFWSYYEGTTSDESIDYRATNINLGYGFEGGIYYKISKYACVSVTVRLNLVPSVNEETMSFQDPKYETEVIRQVTVNPHGNENTLVVTAGLHFGTRKRIALR